MIRAGSGVAEEGKAANLFINIKLIGVVSIVCIKLEYAGLDTVKPVEERISLVHTFLISDYAHLRFFPNGQYDQTKKYPAENKHSKEDGRMKGKIKKEQNSVQSQQGREKENSNERCTLSLFYQGSDPKDNCPCKKEDESNPSQ